MLLDESTNARVFGNGFVRSIRSFVTRLRAFDRHVVDVGDRVFGVLVSKDVDDVVVENWDRVGPTHW